jgi:TIR domain
VALVFISYRRCDDAYAAALLDLTLSSWLGAENVFRASRSIPPGVDFEVTIKDAVRRANVMLVVIGPRWEENFRKRDTDHLLNEITMAAWHGVPLVPILLNGVKPLATMRLPAELDGFDRRQYLTFDYRTFESDASHIAQALEGVIPELENSRRHPGKSMSLRQIKVAASAISESANIGPVTGQILPIGS